MVFSMKCKKSLCQKYSKIKREGSCTYLWNVGRIYAKMVFSMKCRKSLCLENTAILRVWEGSCTYLRNVGRIYAKNGVFYEV